MCRYVEISAPPRNATRDARSAFVNPQCVATHFPPRNSCSFGPRCRVLFSIESTFERSRRYDEVSAPTITSADGEPYDCVHPPGGVDAGIDGYMESPTGFDTPDTDEGYLVRCLYMFEWTPHSLA